MIVNPKYSSGTCRVEYKKTQFPGVCSALSGHRYYSPSLGRFINRDPIGEQGGINLYSFVGNNPVNAYDYLGMEGFGANEFYTDADGVTRGRFVEDENQGDGYTINGQIAASVARMMPSFMAYAEGAAAGALAAVDRNALAKVAAAIQSGQISKDGNSVTISGSNAQSLNAALSWTIGAVSSGDNAVASAVRAGAAAWVARANAPNSADDYSVLGYGVNKNMGQYSEQKANLAGVKLPDGVYAVGAEGSKYYIYDASNKPIAPDQLAAMIRSELSSRAADLVDGLQHGPSRRICCKAGPVNGGYGDGAE